MKFCPYCGRADLLEYIGIDDGGDYGLSVCDQWECHHCGNRFEDGCIESDPYEEIEQLPDFASPDDAGDI